MHRYTKRLLWVAVVVTFWGMALAGCRPAATTPAATATPLPAPTATAPPTLPPTATPTPAPPTAVLLVGEGASAEVTRAAAAWLRGLAQAQGWRYQQANADTALPPQTRVAVGVAVAPPQGAPRRLALALPPDLSPQGVQVLRLNHAGLPQRAFLAGALAAMLTKNWRVGFWGSDQEEALAEAFVHGGRYFCGLCRPLQPPFLAYPQFVLAPSAGDVESRRATWQRLLQTRARTVALSPQALAFWSQNPLPAQGLTLLALAEPSPEQRSAFAAVITTDIQGGLQTLWENPDRATQPAALRIQVLDTQAISPGRLQRAEEVGDLLAQGLIQP